MLRTYELSRTSGIPLYEQLYRALREDILSGALPGGAKLPSKRTLAEHLTVSKITVETAYTQLLAEGYITSQQRSGLKSCSQPHSSRSRAAVCRSVPQSQRHPSAALPHCSPFPSGQS